MPADDLTTASSTSPEPSPCRPCLIQSGSSMSPSVLSPMEERPSHLGRHYTTSSDTLDTIDDALLGTTSRALPIHMLPGYLPLTSPSDDLRPGPIDPFDLPPHTLACDSRDHLSSCSNLPTPPMPLPLQKFSLRLPSSDASAVALRFPEDNTISQSSSTQRAMSGLDSIGAVDGTPVVVRQNPCDTILTPPEEKSNFTWPTTESCPRPQDITSPHAGTETDHTANGAAAPALLSPFTAKDSSCQSRAESHEGGSRAVGLHDIGHISIEGLSEGLSWLSPAIMAIASCIDSTGGRSSSLKVLSHALPTPSLPGHVFSDVIDSIRAQCVPGQLAWINLMHAIPGRFNLSDIPTSPPNTPGQPLAADDYFTSKIFSSAVSAGDYSSKLTAHRPTDRLLSPPGSVDLAVIERYIPPTGSNEVVNLFSINEPSILVDRLVELSPNGGCLAFIYPTSVGGHVFQHDYLAPVLDPQLRTMMSMYDLSADFGSMINRLTVAEHLEPFDQTKAKLETLCHSLGDGNEDVCTRLHGMSGKYSLVYADTKHLSLDPDIWTNWWTKQEKPMLHEAVSQYRLRGSRLPKENNVHQSIIVQEIMTGISKRAQDQVPRRGIQVGVFVMKRG